jgi:hypothetical protein
MNTEPVKTTLRLIAAIIAGAAVISYGGIDLLQAFGAAISDTQQATLVAFITTVVGVVAPVLGITPLRNQVTPWDSETGAMTPGPTEVVHDEGGLG